MYPVLKEGVSVGSFRYEGSDTIHYYIENADGEEFEITIVGVNNTIGTSPNEKTIPINFIARYNY